MSERWQQYFDRQDIYNQGWLKTAVEHWGFHADLYGMIQRHTTPGGHILDIGCGPGFSDLYLASCGYEVLGIDNDEHLLARARDLAGRMQIPVRFEPADAFDLSAYHDQFDLAYSCGVLEHFDRQTTIRLLREQARCARKVLIQIPTPYTRYAAPVTDEHFYSVRQLAGLVREAGMEVCATFGYGNILVTPLHIWFRYLMPRAAYRYLQYRGFAFGIAAIGESGRRTAA